MLNSVPSRQMSKPSWDCWSGSNHMSCTSSGAQKVNEISSLYPSNPDKLVSWLSVTCDRPAAFELKIRIPWWVKGQPVLKINGEIVDAGVAPAGFICVKRTWNNDTVCIELLRGLTAWPLPDYPEMTAFLYGPIVLAGRCDEERTLYGDQNRPETLLYPSNGREWANWMYTFKSRGQDRNLQFIPMYQVGYEPYTVYFPVRNRC